MLFIIFFITGVMLFNTVSKTFHINNIYYKYLKGHLLNVQSFTQTFYNSFFISRKGNRQRIENCNKIMLLQNVIQRYNFHSTGDGIL